MTTSPAKDSAFDTAIRNGMATSIHPLGTLTDVPLGAPSLLTKELITRLRAKASQNHLQTAGLVALAELMELAGDAPRNADLADAMSRGVPEELIEEGLRHPGGFRAAAAGLRIAAVSNSDIYGRRVELGEPVEELLPELKSLLGDGSSITIADIDSLGLSMKATVLNLEAFVSADGLDEDALATTIKAAEDALGEHGVICLTGVAATVMSLGEDYASKKGRKLAADVCKKIRAATSKAQLAILPLSEKATSWMPAESEGAGPVHQLFGVDEDGELARCVKLGLTKRAPERLETLLENIQAAADLDNTPGLGIERLRARGFTGNAIQRVQNALGEGLDLNVVRRKRYTQQWDAHQIGLVTVWPRT